MTLDRRITLGFVAGFLLLAGVSVTSYLVISELREATEVRQRSSSVLSNLRDVLSRVDEAETGARGFVLTGEEQHLQPYQDEFLPAGGLTSSV